MMTHDSQPIPQLMPSAGSKMVVVGGCGGIGRQLVLTACAAQLDVIVVDLERSIEQFPPPENLTAISCDATQSSEVSAAFSDIEKRWGAIDHLVNFVGFTKEQIPIAEMEETEWDEIIDGSLKSAFLIARYGIPLLRQSGGGVLLNMASTFGVSVRHVGYGPYATAKAGIINLTRALACECAPHIRVNAIAPGLIDTEFLRGGTGREAKESRIDRDAVVQSVPMGRIGDPMDIVGTILFLASPAASYITSQTIHVNGGLWS